MRYFACQVQTIINLCSLYLISNSWRPRWRPCLVTSQTSSSATTHKIYSCTSSSSVDQRLSTEVKIVSKYCNISKTLGRGPLPCNTVEIWICVYVQGLMKSLQQDFAVVMITDHAAWSGFNFWVWKWNPWVWPLKWKPLSSSIFPAVLFVVVYNVGLNVNEILKSSHSNVIATGHCKCCLYCSR